jgi:3D (Asp-Asp-Asp) domain-containing protein
MRGLRFFTLGILFLAAGCAQNADRKSAKAQKMGQRKTVRTTAYTHSEGSHRRYGSKNALGTRLQAGRLNSAAADWSRFPVGTKFRIVEVDKEYIIDDYGSALVGTETIDLYVPSRQLMRRWGVRRVTMELVQLGSYEKSLQLLKTRLRNRHVRAMVHDLQDRL